ncbi:hypothetical protein F5X99DRAFT_423146 [Biscogniauxia marginata]|nr:hypothetical protein F5X99DRAFT_423146 [Biscogniauxia marginata]
MTLFKPPGLQSLPYELVAYVARDLDIEDVFNWSLCSKNFRYIIREDRFCKPVILAKAPSTLEAEEARATGHFARALRRLAKRHYALSHASPYVLGVVGLADSYEYINGKLCYILESRPKRWLRILDVNISTEWELVADIPTLVSIAVPRAANTRKYKFKVLYQAADIVSCLFSYATEYHLIIFNPKEHKLLKTYHLDSAHRIFVRNNDNYLYVGTHTGEGADGFRNGMYLNDMFGYDIGSSICFEIFDEYFYGLSNQSVFEIDDPDWTSYYYCFRFPLDEPSRETMQIMRKEDSWRRNHVEGPIDDRWGFLKFERDEATGCISIVECRREWLKGRSGSQRTYYTTNVVFRKEDTQGADQKPAPNVTIGGFVDPPGPNGFIPSRSPHQVYKGDNSSVPSMLTRSKTHYCSYFRSCHTFLDLLDEPSRKDSDTQYIRLRAGYRCLKPVVSAVSDSSTSSFPRLSTELDTQDLSTGDKRSVIYSTSDGSKDAVKVLIFLTFDPAIKFERMQFGGSILGQRAKTYTQPTFLQYPAHSVSMGAESMLRFSSEQSMNTSMTKGAIIPRSADQSVLPIIPPPQGTESWVSVARAMHHEIRQKFSFSL